jgi:hypothetical protein
MLSVRAELHGISQVKTIEAHMKSSMSTPRVEARRLAGAGDTSDASSGRRPAAVVDLQRQLRRETFLIVATTETDLLRELPGMFDEEPKMPANTPRITA